MRKRSRWLASMFRVVEVVGLAAVRAGRGTAKQGLI
jgi:hypothetical protein